MRAPELELETLTLLSAASLQSSVAVLQTLNAALGVIDPDIDALLVFRPECEELVCVFAAGNRAEHFGALRLELQGSSLPAICVQRGHHVARLSGVPALIPTDRAVVAVPMLVNGALAAVAYVASARVQPFAVVPEIVRAVTHATVPYVLACEREADRATAKFDALTGLYTARAFREHVASDVRACTLRTLATLSLWFIDTDGFKQINDTLGHSTGDRVLRQVAEILRSALEHDGDFAGRNGGDEFCALLSAHKIEAIECAQQFCSDLRAQDFGIARRVTVSVGVAAYPQDAQSANALFEAADAAMYHSKRSGRDCVSFAGGPERFIICR